MNVMKLLGLLLCLSSLAADIRADEGRSLYLENCAICHGSEGNGGVGIPLALPAFLRQSPDEYLERSIRFGRPGRIMPAFDHLSDRQIELIVDHIRSWNPDIPAPPPDQDSISGDAARGHALYISHCRECHGKDGEGGRGTGVMFSRDKGQPIVAPAIGNAGFLKSADDPMIRDIIVHGRPGTPMKSADQLDLSDRQVDHLVAYIRSLEQPLESDAPTPLPAEPPILVYDSSYSFQDTVDNVKRAAIGMNFRLIRDQPLDQGLVPEGEESKQHIMVYFCNFKFLYEALAIDPRVGLFLPCRVTVTERDGQVQVMSINPRRLSRLFNNDELDEACDEMHRLYTAILEEATF